MGALLLLLVAATAGAPPLAEGPGDAPTRAAAPASTDALPFFHARRLRLSLGVSYAHLALNAPGANAIGGGASLAYEWRYAEAALSVYGHGGLAAQDARARHTGVSSGHLRASLRVAPFPAWLRVMVEAGGQIGLEPSWSYCVARPDGDQCAVVPTRATWAGVLGVVVLLRAERAHLTLGLDALWRGPAPPEVCSGASCAVAAIREGPLGVQAWLEAGWGGASW